MKQRRFVGGFGQEFGICATAVMRKATSKTNVFMMGAMLVEISP